MDNHIQQKNDEEQRLKNLRQRKEHNLATLERRIHEIDIEKQRRVRHTDKKVGMV